jgi:hypothetical protein
LVVAAGDAIEHLIDDTVDAGIAGVIERNAGRLRVREREAGIVETLIAEARAGVVPGSDPVSARKPFGVLALVGKRNLRVTWLNILTIWRDGMQS